MRVSENRVPFISVSWEQYRIFFDTVAYTEYHALYGVDVVSCRLVISKPHHPPPVHIGIPVHLNDPILELLPRHFHPADSDGGRQVSLEQKRRIGEFRTFPTRRL
jgi:hypothetical protein